MKGETIPNKGNDDDQGTGCSAKPKEPTGSAAQRGQASLPKSKRVGQDTTKKTKSVRPSTNVVPGPSRTWHGQGEKRNATPAPLGEKGGGQEKRAKGSCPSFNTREKGRAWAALGTGQGFFPTETQKTTNGGGKEGGLPQLKAHEANITLTDIWIRTVQ